MAPATPRSPWPQRTTMVVGALLLISGFLLLLVREQVSLPVTETFVIPLSGPVVAFAAALTRAAAFLLAAVGVGGELGFAADSRLGRAAIVVWGLRDLVSFVFAALPDPSAALLPVVGALSLALEVVFVVAALLAALIVIGARVLTGAARWVLLAIAVLDCAFALLSSAPLGVLMVILPSPTEWLDPALTILAAGSLLLWGRAEALKHRAREIHDAW